MEASAPNCGFGRLSRRMELEREKELYHTLYFGLVSDEV